MENPATIALINGRIPDRQNVAVVVSGTRISAIVTVDDPALIQIPQHDLCGQWLLPGFIDVQVNGGGGMLFNDAPSVETLRVMAAAHQKFGSTGFLPTLISSSAAQMHTALEAVDMAIEQRVPGILGIHLEGPFIAKSRCGIHDASLFRVPNADDIAMLIAKHRGKVMLTLAPECVTAGVIATLVEAGVIVVAGHSDADYATTRQALDAGLSGFTHLYNAMPPLAGRAPGIVGAALEDAHSWCGIIADGHHLHPASIRVALAAKTPGKCVLVTDAMPPVGSTHSNFVLGGQPITVQDGRCQNSNGVLAGSVLDIASGVRYLVHQLGLPLAEAARMASTYPAAWLGLQHSHGQIQADYRADFVVLNDQLRVTETWIGGAIQTPF